MTRPVMVVSCVSRCFTVTLILACIGMTTFAQKFTDSGFIAESVITLPPFTPVGLAFAPDGRMFIWQKEGKVRVFKNGALLPTAFIDISARVNHSGDRGLLGLTFDPNFASNGFVYLYYVFENAADPNNNGPRTARITRVRADPNNPDVAQANSETVIVGTIGTAPCEVGTDCISADFTSHTIGTVKFGPDGKLYFGMGDGGSFAFADPLALRAQDLNTFNGKILRVNPDGTAPADNPFYDGNPNAVRSKVYAYGLRNPFRFSIHAQTGQLIYADVGQSAWEELNRGRGLNFGWPCFEGNDPNPLFQNAFPQQCAAVPASAVTKPIYLYPTPPGGAVIGGPFYTATQFPTQYQGNFFFADYVQNFIRRMVFAADGTVASVEVFATDVTAPVSLELGLDGALYYVSITTGEIRRIKLNSNGAPTATATAILAAPATPYTITFSSNGSSDPEGGALTYQWEFADGTTSTAANPAHTYPNTGVKTYSVKLTVTDPQGLSAMDTVSVVVGSRPPVAIISTPGDGANFNVGATVTFTGTATDPDEILTASALSWQVLLHHNDHVHPGATAKGTTGSFVIEDHGIAGTFYYEIILTATDSSGLSATKSIRVNPLAPQPSSGGTGTGLRGDYFNKEGFTDLKLTRIDPVIDFDWGRDKPVAALGKDNFSIRWTGFVQPRSTNSHTFYVTASDTVRLWINGQLLINASNKNVTEYRGTITLNAGQKYAINLEFVEKDKGAAIQLEWASPQQARQIIPRSQLYPQ